MHPINTNSINSFNSYIQKKATIHRLPFELIISIFSSLPMENVLKCAQVCQLWGRIIESKKLAYPRDIVDDFKFLVDEEFLSWEEVPSYIRISNFMDKVIFWGNELLKPQSVVLNPEYKTPQPYARFGNYSFSICNVVDIQVHKKGEKESPILLGKNEIPVICLSVEGAYLFALRQDGMIIQWNYEEGKLVNEIETSYKKDRTSINIVGSDFCCGFHVRRDGVIFIGYKSPANMIEVISTRAKRTGYLPLFDVFDGLTLEKDRIFIRYKAAIGVVCFPEKKFRFQKTTCIELEMRLPCTILDMVVNNDILYAFNTSWERDMYNSFGELHIIDLTTHKKDTRVLEGWQTVRKIQVIENLLFGCSKTKIYIRDLKDLNSKKDIATIDLSVDSLHINDQVLRQLGQMTKKHRVPFRPQVQVQKKDKEKCVIS